MKEFKETTTQIDHLPAVAGYILCNGKMNNWPGLIIALCLSRIDATKGKQEFTDALSAGAFTDNSQRAVFVHLAGQLIKTTSIMW